MSIETQKTTRALGLCSGGLDSILSALVLRNQGIHVEWITFETPFFTAEKAQRAADQTGIPLHIEDITEDYLEMLKHPPAGFGKNMNPCMDCHTMMFNKAGQFMQANGFDFLFSGEVRASAPCPRTSPPCVMWKSTPNSGGRILRPLSAKCMPETPMEQQGFVDRSQLLGLSGRSRKPQMALAKELGIHDYPSPAGGCLLTDPGYSRRLRDLMDHGAELTRNALFLLRHGRHMRLGPETQNHRRRTKQDNEQILKWRNPEKDTLLKVKKFAGPIVIMPGGGPPAHAISSRLHLRRIQQSPRLRSGRCPWLKPAANRKTSPHCRSPPRRQSGF